MTKHPKTRLERIKLREKKEQTRKDGANKVRRRAKNEVREKEAEDEIALVVDNL